VVGNKMLSGKWALKNLAPIILMASVSLAGCQSVPATGFSTEQKAALSAKGFVETPRGWELTMADRLLFASDASTLMADQAAIIANMASELKKVGIISAQVEGHTDATGSHEHNARLSKNRALAVSVPLLASGFQLSANQIVGRGEEFPVGDNASAEGRADNRRVVIIVTP
jgi:outer membrane protein OmpA-like peptidoglycan-associated protein